MGGDFEIKIYKVNSFFSVLFHVEDVEDTVYGM